MRAGFRLCLLPLVLICGIVPASLAQVNDSTIVETEPADSTVFAPTPSPDSTAVSQMRTALPRPPLELIQYPEGRTTDSLPMVRAYEPEVIERLDRLPGNFRYSMGQLGWPDQISLQGELPQQTVVTLDGIPVRDPVTGRALFESLPFDLLDAPRITEARHGAAAGVAFNSREFDVRAPHTELRYRVGGPGLQSISATHVQQRLSNLFGSPSVMQVLFRYASGKWEGDYPNSFSDVTQMDARIGFRSERWILRMDAFLSRRHGGAHSGVIVPDPNDFDTIYQRFNARVNNPNATFRSKRSDVRLAYDRKWSESLRPLSVQFSWVADVRRYRNVSPVEALVNEYTLSAVQELPALLPNQYLQVRFRSRIDDVRSHSLFADTTDLGRSDTELLFETDMTKGVTRISGHAGLSATAGHALPALRLAAAFPSFGFAWNAGFAVSARAPSRLESAGAANVSSPDSDDLVAEKSVTSFAEIQRTFGASRLVARAFIHSTQDPLGILPVAPDSFAVMQSSSGFVRGGLTASLGWRDRLDRGFYGVLRSTIQGSSGSDSDPVLAALDTSIPSFHGSLRFGMRYLLFQGDLDVDVYVRGRYWSQFRGLAYDPVTGALALTAADSPEIGSSGTLDVRLEAGIRTAKAFLGMENVLARSTYPGAMLVPYYPLPARTFRLGIFWPIDN